MMSSWNKIFWKNLKVDITLKIQMIFYRLLTYALFNRANDENSIYKLISDDKISSSLI